MSNLGLFNWIRDGVRQSVLLGVSDAIETIGTPDANGTQLHPALLSFAKNPSITNEPVDTTSSTRVAANTAGANTGRKRLGRSLKDLGPSNDAA